MKNRLHTLAVLLILGGILNAPVFTFHGTDGYTNKYTLMDSIHMDIQEHQFMTPYNIAYDLFR